MKTFKLPIIFILSVFFLGCEKPNPNPELLDPIYSEMQKQAEELKKSVVEEKANVEEMQKSVGSVKPQTGQIAYARKRVKEAEDKLNKIEQMATYWEIRAESRKNFDRAEYSKAWSKKQTWPDPKEYQEYKVLLKAQSAKPNWDNKARMKENGIIPSGEKAAAKKEGGEGEHAKKEE